MTDIKTWFHRASVATLSAATIIAGTGTAHAANRTQYSDQYLPSKSSPVTQRQKTEKTAPAQTPDAVVYRNFDGKGTNLIDITSKGVHAIVEFGTAQGDAIGEGTIVSDTLRTRQDFIIDQRGKFVPLSDKAKPNRHADQFRAIFSEAVQAMQATDNAKLKNASFPDGLWGEPVKVPSGGTVVGGTLLGKNHYTLYTDPRGDATVATSSIDPATGDLSLKSMVFTPGDPDTTLDIRKLAKGNPGDPNVNAARLPVMAHAASILSFGGDNPYSTQPQENGVFSIRADESIARARGVEVGTPLPILDAREMFSSSYASFTSADFHKVIVENYEKVARDRAGYNHRPNTSPGSWGHRTLGGWDPK